MTSLKSQTQAKVDAGRKNNPAFIFFKKRALFYAPFI